MATGVQVWSQSPASNATSDSNINLAEGMAPSALNDSARSMMASVAKWNNDNNGTLITSGSSTALTLVTNQVEGSLTSGYTVGFQFGTAASSAATLAVDGLTAKPLQVTNGTNLIGGEYVAGDYGNFTYSTTGTGQWIAQPSNKLPQAFTSVSGSGVVTSVGGLHLGFGSTWAFTPVKSSRVFVIAQGQIAGSIVGTNIYFQLAYGTGTAPISGAAPTGTRVGSQAVTFVGYGSQTNVVTLVALVTALTPGTAYWADIIAGAGSGSAQFSAISYVTFDV